MLLFQWLKVCRSFGSDSLGPRRSNIASRCFKEGFELRMLLGRLLLSTPKGLRWRERDRVAIGSGSRPDILDLRRLFVWPIVSRALTVECLDFEFERNLSLSRGLRFRSNSFETSKDEEGWNLFSKRDLRDFGLTPSKFFDLVGSLFLTLLSSPEPGAAKPCRI